MIAMRRILLAVLIAVVLLLEVLAVYRFVAPREHHIFDFVQRWHGARALLLEHRNPYSPEVTEEIQMALVGRPLAPDSCQQGFLYPPFVALTIPHFLLPYTLGLSIWIVTLQVLLVAAIWLIVRCTAMGGRINLTHLLLLTLAGVTFRYSLLNLGYGQFSILVLFWIVVTWWLWNRGQFLLAGVALTQVTSKPQLALLLVPMWILLAVARRKWRLVAGFCITMAVLLALPFLFAGNWIPAFFQGLLAAIRTCQIPIYEGSEISVRLGVFLALTGGLLALTVLSPRRWQGQQLGYLLSLVTATTMFGTPFTHSYDLVLTLLPLLYGLVVVRGLQGKGARLLELAFWATLAILPWLLWILVPSHQLEKLESWLFPLLVLVLLAGLAAVQIGAAEARSPASRD
jgi:hypothetical protein